MLYPKANLESQRISDLLSSIGEESSYRAFFREYSKLLAHREGGEDILIDSTGLPNSIHFPLTAVSNHNGQISNEVRLIYVVQQGTNLPLRVQSEDTLRGHLLLAFAAAVICRKLQEELKDTQYTPENALLSLRNHKCKVFDDHVLTMESAKRANDIYKRFKIKVDHVYAINGQCKLE